ncbi:MAG TPA: adenylate/guanylate cyclase domain-containing protein, partial [Acidimicrobiia bacterium]|nr:adenylate/guanylate cyclase domain-containing protein [Acidimicrobiia bacterium]
MPTESLPTGTVTFLFTDIEGSTRLVQGLGPRWVEVLETHNTLVGRAIEANHGIVVKTEGDSFFAVFVSALDATLASGAAQDALASHVWPEDARIRVRMGLHTGVGALGGADYVGLDVHRAARIADAGHGGQTVLSESTAVLVERDLPASLALRDLGKHRLKDLSEPETIFELVGRGRQEGFPHLRTLDAIPNNLPMQLTSFVGREQELAEALRLLDRTRILTLTGPGGTGKTRLSLQVAAEVGDQFPDGVFFVDLAPVSDVEVVPSQILSSLGLQASASDQSPAVSLLDHLRAKSLLLVLDNFEQVLAAAPLVADLVRASSDSKFLVTSRAPLQITGEQEMPIPPLPMADPDRIGDLDELLHVGAISLFAERAVAVRPDFEVTMENAQSVAELVRRLDGLPLAIELVASRLRHLPVSTILERLDARMLSSGSVDLPERQRTIHGAIAWSYDLLDEPTRRLFARLSVFAGGARLEEIERVCGPASELGVDVLEGLGFLLDQSLLRRVDIDAVHRFRMLHVIREYAMGCLEEAGQNPELQWRHLEVYTELAEMVAPELLRKDRKLWLDVMESDHDNIRSALDWAMANGEVDLALRLVTASWRFWQARGHLHEARRRVDSILAMPGGEPRHRAKAMEALGGILWWQARMEECFDVYERVLQMQRELGDPKEIANALYNYGLAAAFTGPESERQIGFEYMEAVFDEAEEIYADLGDLGGLGDIEWARGSAVAYVAMDPESATEHMKKSVHFYSQAGNEFGMGWGLFEVGNVARRIGRYDEAWEYLRRGLELFTGHRDVSAAVIFIAGLAAVAQDLGDQERAERLAGAFTTLQITSGTDLVSHELNRVAGLDYDTLEALTGDS